MFGFSKPRCPLDPEIAGWVEYSMAWLASRFGEPVIRDGKVVVPTQDYFPDPTSSSIPGLTALFDRVSIYMRIDPDTIDLRFFSEERDAHLGGGLAVVSEGKTAAGLYEDHPERHVVSIQTNDQYGVDQYIATMAHELAHVHLIGGGHLDPERDDHEPLTDLATVFFGLGIFNANTVVTDTQWSADGWSGWSIGKQGYLPEEVFGYAFAVYAWRREEATPAWGRFLRPNVRSVFRQGLKYLLKHGAASYQSNLTQNDPVRDYPGHRMDH